MNFQTKTTEGRLAVRSGPPLHVGPLPPGAHGLRDEVATLVSRVWVDHEDRDAVASLVQAARAGDSECHAALAILFRAPLFAHVRALGVGDELAEDVVQDALVQLDALLAKVHDPRKAFAFLVTQVDRAAKRSAHARRQEEPRALGTFSGGEAGDASLEAASDRSEAPLSPEEHVVGALDKAVAAAALRRLSTRDQALLWVRQHTSNLVEAAEAAGSTPHAIAARTSEVVARMRVEALAAHAHAPAGPDCSRPGDLLAIVGVGDISEFRRRRTLGHLAQCHCCRRRLRDMLDEVDANRALYAGRR